MFGQSTSNHDLFGWSASFNLCQYLTINTMHLGGITEMVKSFMIGKVNSFIIVNKFIFKIRSPY